jgi:acyl-CoA thioester hydrolase
MEIRIYYEDTDAGGVVYYANYFKYFERARTHYLEERGLSVVRLLKEGTQFLVVHVEADYRSPARLGDTLTVETTLPQCGRTSVTFAHVIRDRASGRVIMEGHATLVAVDLHGRVKRLTMSLIQALRCQPRSPADGDERPRRSGAARSRRQVP